MSVFKNNFLTFKMCMSVLPGVGICLFSSIQIGEEFESIL